MPGTPRNALLLLALAVQAQAASFPCNAAHTPREKAVCASPALSGLDDRLARAYTAALAQLTPPSAALVRADQRDWITYLEAICPPRNPALNITPCLTNGYNERLQQLTEGIQRIDGVVFFTRARFVYVPGKPTASTPAQRPANDPGFGYGAFAWPQIDVSPGARDYDLTLFNAAIHDAAFHVDAGTPPGDPALLEKAVDADGYSFGYFSIAAADHHLIDVDLGLMTYGWGAAHPLSDQTSFLWSVEGRRALTAADVLRPETDWQTALVGPAITKLQQKLGPNGTWQGKELHDAVAATLKDSRNWDLSTAGLTITFGQYAVASYAQGMPRITFAWAELAPYRNPGFQPSLLPARLEKDD